MAKVRLSSLFVLLNSALLFSADTDNDRKERLSLTDYTEIMIAEVRQGFMPEAFVKMLRDKDELSDMVQTVESEWSKKEEAPVDEYQKMRRLVLYCMIMQKNNQERLERIEYLLQSVIARLDEQRMAHTATPQHAQVDSQTIFIKNFFRDLDKIP